MDNRKPVGAVIVRAHPAVIVRAHHAVIVRAPHKMIVCAHETRAGAPRDDVAVAHDALCRILVLCRRRVRSAQKQKRAR